MYRLALIVSLALAANILGVIQAPPALAAPLTFTDVSPDASDNPSRNSATGGRVNGLAIESGNNQVMYAASEFGGLWKSVNGGASWAPLNGHRPSVTWDVEVDPSNNNRVYATSFFDGREAPLSGIQFSSNSGATWTKPASSTPPAAATTTFGGCSAGRRDEPSAYGIGIHPTSGATYVGTNCGVGRSTDGTTWTFSDPTPGTTATDVWDVYVQDDGTANGIVNICGIDGVHRSVDGGQSWTSLNAGFGGGVTFGRCSIAASPDESYVLFVQLPGTLWETTDGGANWTAFAAGAVNGNALNGGRIPFVTTNQRSSGFDLWIGRGVNLFRAACTTPGSPAPGGAARCPGVDSWVNAQAGAHDDTGDVIFDSAVATDACPVLYSSDGGVHTNTIADGGCHTPAWQRSNVGLHALWLYSMEGAHQPGAATEDLYMGAQDTGSFGTGNVGANPPTWTMPDCCDVFNIAANSTRVVWDRWSGYQQFYGAPGMTGKTAVSTFYPGSATQGVDLFTFPDAIDTFSANDYVAVGGASGTFTTADITATPVVWTAIGNGGPASGFCAVQASVSGGTPTFYAQTGCLGVFETGANRGPFQLWKLVGTGGTWERIDDNIGSGGIEIFSVDPTNPNRLYASNLSGTKGAQMVFSTDGGTTWDVDADLTNLMDGNGFFEMNPSAGPISFTGLGSYVQPSLVAFDPEDPNIVVAGGRESGIFISSNGGADWSLVTDPYNSHTSGVPHLPRPFYAYFDHEPAGTVNVYIGTQGRGVWRITLPNADLSVTKSDSPEPVVAGTNLTYTVGVTNNGPDSAANPSFVDDLPAGVQFQSVTPAVGWTCPRTPSVGSSGSIVCTGSSLASAATATFTVVVKVPASTAHGATLTNTARAFAAAVDGTPANNADSETTSVIRVADLRTAKEDDVNELGPKPWAIAGTNITYTVTVTNDGPSDASDVALTDPLPAGLTYVSSSVPCAGTPLVCTLGSRAAGTSLPVTITASIAPDLVYDNGSPLSILNTATASSTTTDPNPTNNSGSKTTLVKAEADLAVNSVTAVAPVTDVLIGEPEDVLIRTVITQSGPSSPMDVDLAYGAVAPAGGTVSPANAVGFQSALANGELRSVDRTFSIGCTAPGMKTFTFSVGITPNRADDADPNGANNSGQTTVTVDCVVPVQINIQPKGDPNANNVRQKGVVPVAILSTLAGEYGLPLAFDATTIIGTSVRFGPNQAVWDETGGAPDTDGTIRLERSYEMDERTRDDDLDALTHYEMQMTGLTITDTEGCVKGQYDAGGGEVYSFFGCDVLRVLA